MALLAAGCTPADPLNILVRHSGFDLSASLPYGSGARQTLDVYRPDRAAGAPVIVFFYGGSWQNGTKETYLFAASALAKRGYLIVVPDYRVYPEVRFPSFLEDGARAVRWAKQHAGRFGGDPENLFVMGHSAGAHIAAMLAIDARWLGAAGLDPRRDLTGLIGVSGPYDFLPVRNETLKIIFGGDRQPDTQPITYVKGGEPPALLVTGSRDDTVDPGNAFRLATRLHENGASAKVIEYPHVGHLSILGAFAAPLRFLAPVLDVVDAFVTRVVPKRPQYATTAAERSR
jgi:acetyl esterase/lipase